MSIKPGYCNIDEDEWEDRAGKFNDILKCCTLCPRKCRVNRLEDEKGFCKSGKEIEVSSISPHFGEEQPLVGRGGSGTVFLTNCNLGCIYCQNYDISHLGYGKEISVSRLADRMIDLQKLGCHNINFVTPTHFTPQIAEAIRTANKRGLMIPVVYNCGGYESLETIELLEGIVDIYMPDFKYSDNRTAEKYSEAPDYFETCCKAIIEMHRQVGDLETEGGIAHKGLLIRHLVLPNGLAGSKKIMEFIAEEVSRDTYVNIMRQYHPQYNAQTYSELRRPPLMSDFDKAVSSARRFGLHRGFRS